MVQLKSDGARASTSYITVSEHHYESDEKEKLEIHLKFAQDL